MKLPRAFWLLPYFLLPLSLAQGAALPDAEKEVTIKADTLSVDVPADTYRAEGAVRLEQAGVSLLADSVTYSRLTGNAFAEGDVLLQRNGDTVRAEQLSLNLISQRGQLSNAEFFVKKGNFHAHADAVEKTGLQDYRLKGGSFTTCDGEKPSWRFEASEIKVSLDDLAYARNAVFYAGDVPILYTPYLIFPVKRERQTGLLLPKLGHSSKKGLYIDQPFYWAINPSQEVTFNLALESARGVGVGADYRYLRSGGSEGRLQGFGIYDNDQGRFRGELNQSHLELLPNTTLASDIHLLTDRDYYRDYGDFSGDYNRQLLISTASFSHRWERYGLSGELRYTEDLDAPDNDETLQKLPEVKFIAAGEKIGPLLFSMDSRLVNFERTEGQTGRRLELHPRLTYYAKPTQALEASLYAGYRQRFYDASGAGNDQIGQADAGGMLSLPLERIYQGSLRHLMIPALEYSFVQEKDDDDAPFFDWDDRVLGQSIAWLSVTNYWTTKRVVEAGPAEYRDLLYLKIAQGYQFSGERRDLLTLVDEGHKVTDLMLEGRYTPRDAFTVGADARVNPVAVNLSTASLGAEVKADGNKSLQLLYRYSREALQYLEGNVAFPITAAVSATALGRYSFDKGGFLESRYSVEYRHQCWSVVLSYIDRPGSAEIPHNREFTVNFTLAGLGALGPVRAL
jgi:LPS-assembly protein